MKVSLIAILLVLTGSEGLAQAPAGSRWSVEVTGGAASFRESFPSDCCGPTRKAAGTAFALRAAHHENHLVELGAEVGATFAGGREMKWLMPVVGLSRRGRLTATDIWTCNWEGAARFVRQQPCDSLKT